MRRAYPPPPLGGDCDWGSCLELASHIAEWPQFRAAATPQLAYFGTGRSARIPP